MALLRRSRIYIYLSSTFNILGWDEGRVEDKPARRERRTQWKNRGSQQEWRKARNARERGASRSGGRCYSRVGKGKARQCSPGLRSSNGWETQSFFISALSSVSFHPVKQSSAFLSSTSRGGFLSLAPSLSYYTALRTSSVVDLGVASKANGKTNEATLRAGTWSRTIPFFFLLPISLAVVSAAQCHCFFGESSVILQQKHQQFSCTY